MQEQPNPILVVTNQSPNTYLTRGYFGKKKGGKTMKKKEKSDDKKENKEWDTGFGELYEKIGDRKKQKLFPTMEDLMENK
jgi:hypothetical protein